MPTSRRENRVLETYARALIEAAKSEGRVFPDRRALDAIAEASPEVLAVIKTMVERDQLDLLPQVADAYRQMVDEDGDVVGVTITTAVPLEDDLREEIRAQYEADLGCQVFLIERVDPAILGGVIVEARGERRDASVRTQLRAAREALDVANLTSEREAAHAGND